MDDIILVSSDSDEDSDIRIVGSYNDDKKDAVPFIRAELLAVTPVLVDITKHPFSALGPTPKRGQSPTIEVIDLSNDSPSCKRSKGDEEVKNTTSNHKRKKGKSLHLEKGDRTVSKSSAKALNSPCTESVEINTFYLDETDNFLSAGQDKCYMVQDKAVEQRLEETTTQKSVDTFYPSFQYQSSLGVADFIETERPEVSHSFDISNEHLPLFQTANTLTEENTVDVKELQNTNASQPKFSSSTDHSTKHDIDVDEKYDIWNSPKSWLDKSPSLFSLDSPYYCPSEIDIFFSDESVMVDNKLQTHTAPTISEEISGGQEVDLTKTDVLEAAYQHQKQHNAPEAQLCLKTLVNLGGESPSNSLPCGQEQSVSPTSTELLAGDSPDTVVNSPDLFIESPPNSPLLQPLRIPPSAHLSAETVALTSEACFRESSEHSSSSQVMRRDSSEGNERPDISEPHTQDRNYISVMQYKKLKHLFGGGVSHDMQLDDDEGENYGPAEPLCRQSLSLVYSTIEESYPEGTVQLLSDFIQPRYYPPKSVVSHLLKGILLDPHCAEVLAVEAYNLLMKTQKYHPADLSAIPWDWEFLASVMSEQDEVKRPRSDVRWLLFDYVLRVMQDDYRLKLSALQLHKSIAKEMLSHQKFRHVRDLLNWLLDTAKQSLCHSEKENIRKVEQNCCLKMLVILQRMLLFAVEVDCTPVWSTNKLSEELCNNLNSMAPCRQLRLLLLRTLESNLLRLKLLVLLLDQACSKKTNVTISLNLLLHFLETATLPPDPSDGAERWKRWDELLQLLWMMMLSYEEVVTGHLRFSVTERFTTTRAPMWAQNDQLTPAAVQNSAAVFLTRAAQDLGHELPSKIQDSLSQLQSHLLVVPLH